MSDQLCELEDIQYHEDITQLWSVNEYGQPICYLDSTDSADFVEYHCDSCGEAFGTWEEVQEHLQAKKDE